MHIISSLSQYLNIRDSMMNIQSHTKCYIRHIFQSKSFQLYGTLLAILIFEGSFDIDLRNAIVQIPRFIPTRRQMSKGYI